MLNFLMPTMWHQIPHAELRHNFRCRKCPICALFSAGDDFWCRKTRFLAPNSAAPQLPVQKMPNLCTKLGPEQLPVQKNTLFDTKLSAPADSGAKNAFTFALSFCNIAATKLTGCVSVQAQKKQCPFPDTAVRYCRYWNCRREEKCRQSGAKKNVFLHQNSPPAENDAKMSTFLHQNPPAPLPHTTAGITTGSRNRHKTKKPAFLLVFCAGEGTRTPTSQDTRS